MKKSLWLGLWGSLVSAMIGCSHRQNDPSSGALGAKGVSCTLPPIDAAQKQAIDEIMDDLSKDSSKLFTESRYSGIPLKIVGRIYDKVNSMAWEKGLHQNNRYNVLVLNTTTNDFVANLYGSYSKEFSLKTELSTFKYKVWVFSHGTFENVGENGYKSWAMYGTHNHQEGINQKYVTFTQPQDMCEK